jgi:lipopolysaccharide biosynthesis regulator YciM
MSPLFWALVLLILLALVVTLAIVLLRMRRKKGESYPEVLKLLSLGKKEEARARLEALVRARKQVPIEAYVILGNLMREGGEPMKALKIHRTLLPGHGLSREERMGVDEALALDYLALGHPGSAVPLLEGLSKSRGDLRTRELLLRAYEDSGDLKKALEVKKAVLKDRGESFGREYASYLAWAASKLKESEREKEAEDYLKKALKLDPDNPLALWLKGEKALRDGHSAEAGAHWVRLFRASGKHRPLLFGKLEEYFYETEQLSALRNLYEGLQDVWSKLALLRFYYKLGDESIVRKLKEELLSELESTVQMSALYDVVREFETTPPIEIVDKMMETLKNRPMYACGTCGTPQVRFLWRCPHCGSIDTLEEIT